MKITGIICEYNPLHRGHAKQLSQISSLQGAESGIVCLMSGNYVQRGQPAMIDKHHRAAAALACGADLVLELPVTYSLSSAEGFAAKGVSILSPFCDALCFGAETPDPQQLMQTAAILLSPEFSNALRKELDYGKSFPAARQDALAAMGFLDFAPTLPNDILAVEYCKAILSQGSAMQPLIIQRAGSYHDTTPDLQNPSATFLRQQLLNGADWEPYVPETAIPLFQHAPLHTIAAGERAVLTRLRTMTDSEFEALPHGSEGLWRKLMHNSRSCGTLEEILTATKSKRYTRTRLDRMVMCAFLGITAQILDAPAPYVRVLALNSKGREILKIAREFGAFPHIGQPMPHPYWNLEQRCDDMYGLFALDAPESAGVTRERRITLQA